MFTIEKTTGNGQYRKEEAALVAMFKEMGFVEGRDYQTASIRQIRQNKIIVDEQKFASGSIDFIHACLRQKKKHLPVDNTYPRALRHERFFNRPLPVWKKFNQVTYPTFIKPAIKKKLFTGRVAADSFWDPLGRPNEYVWTAEPVNFIAEFRVYVVDGKWRGTAAYKLNDEVDIDSVQVDVDMINEAIGILHGQDLSDYAIDFGVLNTGETSLIKYNHGYSIEIYNDFSIENYAMLLQRAWIRLMK